MKKIFSNKIFVIGISFILLLFWVFFSILTINRVDFSILTFAHRNQINTENFGKIIKNQSVSGELKAKDNNLGLVILKFENYTKPEFELEDILLFQLWDQKSGKLMYSKEYRSGFINGENELLVGFPKITNSKNRDYKFILTSLKGNEKNSTQIDKSTFFSGYQFSKPEISGSPNSLYAFGLKKILFNFSDVSFLLASSIYLIPFVIFLLSYLYLNKKNQLKKYLWLFTLAVIIADLFLVQDSYVGQQILIVVLWVSSMIVYSIKSGTSFIITFVLVFMWLILFYLGVNGFSEKINILAYLFLVFGTIQLVFENLKK